MSDEIDLDKTTVWVNRVDLTLFGFQKIIYQIYEIKKCQGYVFICSEDLSKKELKKLFKGVGKLDEI